IKDGKLEKHLRKLRRYYKTKSDIMKSCIKKYFDEYEFNETAMYFEIIGNPDKLKGSDIKPMRTSNGNIIRLNFSQISSELIESGIEDLNTLLK
ncbi:MAG: hypothetical protein IJ725_05310, partial [Ruminococcus sp.]|nr:hypothetical protein [Ruminococcus sp.]